LAAMLHINPNTVQKAYKVLEEQGLIDTDRNNCSRVTSNEQKVTSIKEKFVDEAVEFLILSVQSVKVPLDELKQIISEKYSKA
jgi:GntR family transcriptional regulator